MLPRYHLITSLPHHLIASSPHCLVTSSPHCLITSLPRHLITSSPHCLVTSSPHCLITSSPHCLITSSPHCLITSSPHCLITSSPHCLITSSPHCLITSLPHCLITSSPHCLVHAPPLSEYISALPHSPPSSFRHLPSPSLPTLGLPSLVVHVSPFTTLPHSSPPWQGGAVRTTRCSLQEGMSLPCSTPVDLAPLHPSLSSAIHAPPSMLSRTPGWSSADYSLLEGISLQHARRYSLQQLHDATDGFNDQRVLGEGGFGKVRLGEGGFGKVWLEEGGYGKGWLGEGGFGKVRVGQGGFGKEPYNNASMSSGQLPLLPAAAGQVQQARCSNPGAATQVQQPRCSNPGAAGHSRSGGSASAVEAGTHSPLHSPPPGSPQVYHGELNGEEVAIKKATEKHRHGGTDFKNEIELLTAVSHGNLVKLTGFCVEKDEQLLVFEFMEGGALDAWIKVPLPDPLPPPLACAILDDTFFILSFLSTSIPFPFHPIPRDLLVLLT
ncbi:unnamed protein product [Closterium sp. NIES-54]